jgi:Conjugative transposon, TraM
MQSANRFGGLMPSFRKEKEDGDSLRKESSFLSRMLNWLKRNWILVVTAVVLIVTYFGLQILKSSLQNTDGLTTHYHQPAVPDFTEENQSDETAQNKNDRVETINQKQTESDQNQEFTRYSSAQAYEQNPSIEAKPTPKLKPEKSIEPNITQPLKRTYPKPQKQAESSEREVKMEESEGFNTVILSPQNTASSVAKTANPSYFKAAIHGKQTVRSGSQVRIRLLEAFNLDSQEIPANSICTGIALLSANRVAIALTSVQVHGQQIPFKKIVCDRDLLPGIAFAAEDEQQQQLRQQAQSSIDQTTNQISNNLPILNGTAGVVVATGTGIVNGISRAIRTGATQKKLGEIILEEGYKVFIKE